ncbi:MAG: oxygen-independent coproporphyrinogen III oxidase [Pseudomonadota bacterium]
MDLNWHRYLSARAPRYTSYPSALHFDGSIAAEDFAAKLEEVDLYRPLSLYVHVPFCRQLCWYCGCNMRVENAYERALPYVDALIGEMALVGARLEGAGTPMSVHFGGGTPNFLRSREIQRILEAIEAEIGLTDDATLAMEIDPRLVEEGDVAALSDLGVSRLSLGVQDFDPAVQASINRHQSYELIESVVSQIRSAGIDDLSFDVLYGLPSQTEASFSDTIDLVMALAPDRVSVFGYAHMPSALPRQRAINTSALPDAAARYALSALADEKLLAGGYERIGFDHYARPANALAKAAREGRLKRNFQGFTEDPATAVIGFGASAISFVDGLYAQNHKSPKAYGDAIASGSFATERGLLRTRLENVVAGTINDLLCKMRADVSEVLRAAKPQDAVGICAALEQLEGDGLIRWSGDVVEIAEGAHAFARTVATAIDPYMGGQKEFALSV